MARAAPPVVPHVDHPGFGPAGSRSTAIRGIRRPTEAWLGRPAAGPRRAFVVAVGRRQAEPASCHSAASHVRPVADGSCLAVRTWTPGDRRMQAHAPGASRAPGSMPSVATCAPPSREIRMSGWSYRRLPAPPTQIHDGGPLRVGRMRWRRPVPRRDRRRSRDGLTGSAIRRKRHEWGPRAHCERRCGDWPTGSARSRSAMDSGRGRHRRSGSRRTMTMALVAASRSDGARRRLVRMP